MAIELTLPLIILDDLKARKLADKLDLYYTSTLGIILKAKQEGIISAVKPILEILKIAGE